MTKETRALVEDINKFGLLGEALRYPYHTVNPGVIRKILGSDLPETLVVDIPPVIGLAKEASDEFDGLIDYLQEYGDHLQDSQADHYS